MPPRLDESPFHEVGMPKRWEVAEVAEVANDVSFDDLVERPLPLTILGSLMLVIGGILLIPALSLGYQCYLFTNNGVEFRDAPQALTGLGLILFVLVAPVLQSIMGYGLLHIRPWARRGTLVTLPITLVTGSAELWVFLWLRDSSTQVLYPVLIFAGFVIVLSLITTRILGRSTDYEVIQDDWV